MHLLAQRRAWYSRSWLWILRTPRRIWRWLFGPEYDVSRGDILTVIDSNGRSTQFEVEWVVGEETMEIKEIEQKCDEGPEGSSR